MQSNKKITILLVEDDGFKVNKISDLIEQKTTSDYHLKVVDCSNDAKEFLKKNHVDLLILDLCIPRLQKGMPVDSEGASLFKEIHRRTAYSRPLRTIVLSAYDEVREQHKEIFDEYAVTSFKYDERSEDWGDKLSNILNTLSESLESKVLLKNDAVQVVIVTALRSELEAVLNYINANWQAPEYLDPTLTIYKGILKTASGSISVVTCHSLKMGLLPSAILTYKLIEIFSPKLVLMTGVCAGRNEKVNLGDVVAASCSWDWQAGRLEKVDDVLDVKHRPDYYQISAEVDRCLEDVMMDNTDMLSFWNNFNNGKKSSTPSSIVKGPMASGSVVIAATGAIDEIINQHQSVIGFDMETYGVYYACSVVKESPRFLSIKGVCDFADSSKNKEYQPYAAYMSAKVCELILNKQYSRLLA